MFTAISLLEELINGLHSDGLYYVYITIGIDVGGTNTDVAIRLQSLFSDESVNVVSWAKSATTHDITSGIVSATKKALSKVHAAYSGKEIYITMVSIGTTHFVNAIEQRSAELAKICVLRLCGPVSASFQPFCDFPRDLKQIIDGGSYLLDGGLDYDGSVINNKPVSSDANLAKLDEIVTAIRAQGIKSVAISGIFSPMNAAQEIEMEQLLRAALGVDYCRDMFFTLSHQISGLGLLPRENASILNAAICPMASRIVASFEASLRALGITAPLFMTKNDGTQCTSAQAVANPIGTFSSGPTNSMKGAALLVDGDAANQGTMVVCDIGGTTSDVGLVHNGCIQLSSTKHKMAGIDTNFAAPNVVSKAIGGGTIVEYDADGVRSVGPTSVGYDLTRSKCFVGGDTLTLTDVAFANGCIVAKDLQQTYGVKVVAAETLQPLQTVIEQASQMMHERLTELIDAARGERNDLVLVLCGGGASLVSLDFKPAGICDVVRPEFAQVANALGAASAQISAHLDVMHKFEGLDRDEEIEKFKTQTIEKAVENGAKEGSVHIATLEEIPIAYIPGDMKRVLIKAVGDVDPDTLRQNATKWIANVEELQNVERAGGFGGQRQAAAAHMMDEKEEQQAPEEQAYERSLSENGKVWTLSTRDIDYLSIGCGVLGTGGGGSTNPFDVLCKQYLEQGHQVRIVKADTLAADTNVVCVLFMGAPAMLSEKLMGETELVGVVQKMEQYLKDQHQQNENSKLALICGEIGGCNGLTPIITAAQFSKEYGRTIDLVDADFMGRAFPKLQMILPGIHGKNIAPVMGQDEYGNQALLTVDDVKNNEDAEVQMRAICVAMKMKIACSLCPLKGHELKHYTILNSYEFAWKIGKIIYEAKERNLNPLHQLQQSEDARIRGGRIVYSGKIVNLDRRTEGGFTRSTVTLQRIRNDMYEAKMIAAENIFVDIQNENYLIRTNVATLITVPDLIVMFDDEYRGIATEELRYGLRVTVMVFPAHPLMRSEAALRVVGPAAFGYNVDYIPIEQLQL